MLLWVVSIVAVVGIVAMVIASTRSAVTSTPSFIDGTNMAGDAKWWWVDDFSYCYNDASTGNGVCFYNKISDGPAGEITYYSQPLTVYN